MVSYILMFNKTFLLYLIDEEEIIQSTKRRKEEEIIQFGADGVPSYLI